MVSFEEIPEVKSAAKTNTENDETDDGAKWDELMGQDLVMKVIANDESSSTDEETDTSTSTQVQPQDAVVVDFIGRLAESRNDENGPIFQEAQDWLVVIGEKDVLPALELAIRFMRVGQRAVVWSKSKFAYGPSKRKHGDYELPANSSIRYEIVCKSVTSSDRIVEDPSFQIKVASSKKRIGNDMYANEWSDGYGKARTKLLYKRAADMMEFLLQGDASTTDDGTKKQAREIMLDCLNNIAAIHLRAKEFHLAKEAAVKVLTHDPDNLKGLLRAAKASLLDPASSYEEVEMAIAAAETNHPDDEEVRKLRIDLKQRKQAYKKKSKEMFSKPGKNGKETAKKGQEANDGGKPMAKSNKDATTADTQVADDETETKATPWWRKNWRQWEWWNVILPYAIQFTMPFVTYYAFTFMKKKEGVILESMLAEAHAAKAAGVQTSNDEFGSEL